MIEFFQMGGYAPYVWSAFGVTLIVLVGNVIAAKRTFRRIEQSISGQLRREQNKRDKRA